MERLRQELRKKPITPEMTITELFGFHDKAATVFTRMGMPEIGFVPGAIDARTIAEVATIHGRDPEQVINALNVNLYGDEDYY